MQHAGKPGDGATDPAVRDHESSKIVQSARLRNWFNFTKASTQMRISV